MKTDTAVFGTYFYKIDFWNRSWHTHHACRQQYVSEYACGSGEKYLFGVFGRVP